MRPIDRALAWAKARRWNQRQLADELGVSSANVTNWKRRGLPPDLHQAVADVFNRSVDELLGRSQPPPAASAPGPLPAATIPARPRRIVWVVGTCQGGLPESIWDDAGHPVGATDEYTEVATDDPNAFVCRVVGDSMSPRYQPGEYALVEPNTAVEIEDDVLVRLATGETMLKRLVSRRGGYRFDSYRPGEPTLTYRTEEVTWVYHVAHPIQARKISMAIDVPSYSGPERRHRNEPVDEDRRKK